jgi:hypothetical protein
MELLEEAVEEVLAEELLEASLELLPHAAKPRHIVRAQHTESALLMLCLLSICRIMANSNALS